MCTDAEIATVFNYLPFLDMNYTAEMHFPVKGAYFGHSTITDHSAGRIFTSDWFLINSFITVVYEKYFCEVQSEIPVQSMTKKIVS